MKTVYLVEGTRPRLSNVESIGGWREDKPTGLSAPSTHNALRAEGNPGKQPGLGNRLTARRPFGSLAGQP